MERESWGPAVKGIEGAIERDWGGGHYSEGETWRLNLRPFLRKGKELDGCLWGMARKASHQKYSFSHESHERPVY